MSDEKKMTGYGKSYYEKFIKDLQKDPGYQAVHVKMGIEMQIVMRVCELTGKESVGHKDLMRLTGLSKKQAKKAFGAGKTTYKLDLELVMYICMKLKMNLNVVWDYEKEMSNPNIMEDYLDENGETVWIKDYVYDSPMAEVGEFVPYKKRKKEEKKK